MAKYFREEDAMLITGFRGISIGILATPLILLYSFYTSNYPSMSILLGVLPGTFCAVISTVSMGEVFKKLSVSLGIGWCLSSYTIFSWLIDVFYTGILPTTYQNIGVSLLLLSIFFISFDKSDTTSISLRPIIFSLLFGLFSSASNFIVGLESNYSNPFWAGYLWEFSIGVVALMLSFKKLSSLKIKKHLRGVALSSSPTIGGTGLFMLATTLGPIGICSAVLSSQLIFSSIIARFAYSEPLTFRKIIGIIMVTVSILILRLS